MKFGQAFGRILFVAFLIVRGIQHIQTPDGWSKEFVAKYDSYYNTTSTHPVVVENIPPQWLNHHLHPSSVSTYVTQYGGYIGYTELALAASIILAVPLLPLIGATFLALETVIFFNPFNPKFGAEIYLLVINLALVGVVYMMAFAPPLFKVFVSDKSKKGLMTNDDATRIREHSEKTGRNQNFSERATKAANRNSKRS